MAEKETLALVESLEYFRIFIFGLQIQCYVDQKAVLALLTQEHPSKYVRYRIRIQPYQPMLKYVKDYHNRADWVSRLAENEEAGRDFEAGVKRIRFYAGKECEPQMLQDIQTGLVEDAFYLAWKQKYDEKEAEFKAEEMIYKTEEGTMVEGKFLFRKRVYVPQGNRLALVQKMHYEEITLKHLGSVKTLKSLRQRYFWPRMQQTVQAIIQNCQLCIRSKRRTFKFPLKYLAVPPRKFDDIHLDFYGSNALKKSGGYLQILTVTDRVSGYTHFIPCRSRKTPEIKQKLFES